MKTLQHIGRYAKSVHNFLGYVGTFFEIGAIFLRVGVYAFAEEGHTFFGVGVYVFGLELRTVIPTLLIKRGPG